MSDTPIDLRRIRDKRHQIVDMARDIYTRYITESGYDIPNCEEIAKNAIHAAVVFHQAVENELGPSKEYCPPNNYDHGDND